MPPPCASPLRLQLLSCEVVNYQWMELGMVKTTHIGLKDCLGLMMGAQSLQVSWMEEKKRQKSKKRREKKSAA